MTLRDKIAEAVHEAIDSVHDMDVTFDDYAQASADAILSVIAESVVPLVWVEHYTHEETGRYEANTVIGETYHVSNDGWWLPMCVLNKCNGIEAAKAAAQADYTRRILSALGLSTPEQEAGNE